MALGEASREIYLPTDLAAAFTLCVAAAGDVGAVLERNAATGTIVARTRHGLQRVTLRISVLPDGVGARVVVAGFADDIWGGGARRGADKFIRALSARLA